MMRKRLPEFKESFDQILRRHSNKLEKNSVYNLIIDLLCHERGLLDRCYDNPQIGVTELLEFRRVELRKCSEGASTNDLNDAQEEALGELEDPQRLDQYSEESHSSWPFDDKLLHYYQDDWAANEANCYPSGTKRPVNFKPCFADFLEGCLEESPSSGNLFYSMHDTSFEEEEDIKCPFFQK
jgi:hypothetical protein